LAERNLKYLNKLNALKVKEAKAIFGFVISLDIIFNFSNFFTFFLECLNVGGKTLQIA